MIAPMPVDADAVVLSNTRLSPDYNVLALAAPEIARRAQPGQFVMVRPSVGDRPLLRRPFSVFEALADDDGRVTGLSLLNKRIGTTTRALFALEPGAAVRCLGPLGRPFSPAARPESAWLVAGGVGLAPFHSLAVALRAGGVETTLFYGARSAGELFRLDTFRGLGVRLALATDDGSRGDRGAVTRPLERALRRLAPADRLRVYACGPTPMMRAVTDLVLACGHPAEVSLEPTMGCGLGGCYSCVVPVRPPGEDARFVRACLHGPVFDGGTVVWDALGAA